MKELKPDAAELAVMEAQLAQSKAAVQLAEAKLRVEILALEKSDAEAKRAVTAGVKYLAETVKPQTLEERVAALEKKLAEMEAKMTKGPRTGTSAFAPSTTKPDAK